MTRTTTSICILVLLALAFVGSAHAELIVNTYTNSFAASSSNNEQLKLCACEQKVDRVIVENTGSFTADFHVATQTPYPSIRIPKADFQLAPGHFEEVLIYIDDSCSFRGEMPYDVVVTNSYGRAQRISRSIRVDSCQTASLDVGESPSVGLCEPARFDVHISNVGTFADTFTLDFGPYNGNVALSNNKMYLQPGETAMQEVNVTLDCRETGTRSIPFTLTTAKGGQQVTLSRTMTVRNEYDVELRVPSNAEVCVGTTTRMPVTVRNLAPAPDRVTLRTSGDATLPGELSIPAGEAWEIELALAPTSEGRQEVKLQATSAYGGATKERTITLDGINCYDVAVSVLTNYSAPVTEPVSACCGYQDFLVNVRNNAERSTLMQLAIDGPSIFSLDETSVRLDPGQNVNVPLRVRLPCTDDSFSATVIAWPQGQPQQNATTRVVVNSQTQRTCHRVQIDDDELRIRQDANSTALTLKHTGSAGGTYDIATNSSILRIVENNVTLSPGKTVTLHLVSTGNLSEQPSGRYIVRPTFTLQDRGIAYNEALGVQLVPAPWRMSFAWLRAFTWCTSTLLLLVVLLIVALVMLFALWAGWNAFPTGLPRTTLNVVKAVLIVVIGVLLIVMILFVQPPAPQAQYEREAHSSGYVIEWYQDQQHEIDVTQYFRDPDQDNLVFTVTQPTNIAAHVQNSTLILIPDVGFAGANNITITATDGYGGHVESPPFTLRVIAKRHIGFIGWLNTWCHYLIMGLLILLVFVVLLIVISVKERRAKPYQSNVLVVVEKPVQQRRSASRKAPRATPSKATASRNAPTRARTSTGSRARTPVLAATPAQVVRNAQRGRQVSRATVVREYKASGQTVNIAVAPQPATAPTIVSVPGTKQSEVVFVGSKGGDKVHAPYCAVARRIPRGRRVAFSSKREALNAGLIPCRTCRPFEGGM